MVSQRTVLLLNASNLKPALIYPYAFVQVSEIADRFDIRTVRKDMYGIPENQWEVYLQKLFQKDSFDMILITLRNTDSVEVISYREQFKNNDYHQPIDSQSDEHLNYFPIEATKRLIQILRKLIEIPIVIGGFGFSIMPEKLIKYLQPDYGVVGGPDAFFEHFEDVIEKKDLNQIANLVYLQAETLQKGPLQFFPPASRQEYTDEIIADRQAFYSRFSGGIEEAGVSIEVVRGCRKNCSFCAEPLIEGRRLQYRNLDVIEDEINFLRKYQLNRLFFICSEINTGGNEFVMKLADRIIRINKEREEYEKLSWYSLHLLTFSTEELKHLRKAGFLGGSSDVVSLDETNLSIIKAPTKSNDIIDYFLRAKKVVMEEFQQKGKRFHSLEERIFRAPQHLNSGDFVSFWNIFLGNIAVTPETIRVTIKAADDAGLNQIFDSCHVIKATRLYDYIPSTDDVLEYTWSSVKGKITNSYNEVHPSYVYPPALLRHFGSEEAIEKSFVLIGDTYLSNRHLFKKDWNWFLANNISSETFLSWWNSAIISEKEFNTLTAIPDVLDFLTFLYRNPSAHNIRLLFNPTPSRKALINFSANIAIQFVLFSQEKHLIPIMETLGLPPSLKTILNLSPYKIAVILFKIYSNKDDLYTSLNERSLNTALSKFFVEYLIYLNSIPLKSEFQTFFVHNGS